jgi:hypothetical protein
MIKKYCSLHYNIDFLEINTRSICPCLSNTIAEDPKGIGIYTKDVSNNRVIGESTLKVLSKSRILDVNSPDVDDFLFSSIRKRYNANINCKMQKYDYKTKTAMLKNMQLCYVEQTSETITFIPLKHDKLEGYDGMDKIFNVMISAGSSLEIIGAAVKYSIVRCTGKGADLVAEKLFPDGVPDTFDDYLASLNLLKA